MERAASTAKLLMRVLRGDHIGPYRPNGRFKEIVRQVSDAVVRKQRPRIGSCHMMFRAGIFFEAQVSASDELKSRVMQFQKQPACPISEKGNDPRHRIPTCVPTGKPT